jgi:hypothetical protein
VPNPDGRYGFHDLIRAYAVELVESDAERDEAVRRMLDHYLRTGHAATLRATPTRDPLPLPEKPGGVTVPTIENGQGWLAAEYRVLLAAIRFAWLHGSDEYAPGLSWALEDFCYTQGRWHEWCEIAEIAANAARPRSATRGPGHLRRLPRQLRQPPPSPASGVVASAPELCWG